MKTKTFLRIVLLAIFFTILSYLYFHINFAKAQDIWGLVKTGYPQVKSLFLSNKFFAKYPDVFVILTWCFIGVGLYLFYYSVSAIYTAIRNWSVMEFIYTKPEVKENSHPKSVVTRVLIHAGVIVLYLLFLALLILIALPLTKMIYSVSIANLKYANYVLTFIFWLIFNIIFYLALVAGNKYLSKEKIEEEHGFEELK
jgi:hypothetical protein